jgi:hypothetical protein
VKDGTPVALREAVRELRKPARRRHIRFDVGQSWEGAIRVLRDVSVQSSTRPGALTVVSEAPVVVGEWLTLDLAAGSKSATLPVRVTDCRPSVADGSLQYALSLLPLEPVHGTWSPDPLETSLELNVELTCSPRTATFDTNAARQVLDVLGAAHVFGVLSRESSVRACNLSHSGCLLETDRRLEQGTSAALRLEVDGDAFDDPVRVIWCHRVEGAGERWRIGAEFLWTDVPHRRSLRLAVGRLQQQVAQRAQLEVAQPTRIM